MAWFRKDKKPRVPKRERLEIPPDAWEKCEACGHTDLREKFARNLNVCPTCDYHRRIRAAEYASILFDEGNYEEIASEVRSTDPLGFPEYPQRLKKATGNAGDGDALLAASGVLGEMPVNIGVMDFAFMGGSMGSVVGEKISRLGQRSLERKFPLIIISASGGARMQEGVLSLMQMAKASAILSQLAERKIPYISILTNPTTGGVSASYAMLGDAIIAEPGAVIGFAGPRVIKQTLGQDLPEGFQTAEFLLEHGMLDQVVHRRDLKRMVGTMLRHMTGKPAAQGVELALSAYQRALDFLFARTGSSVKVGLARTEALLTAVGRPHEQFPAFHVAGTNGKGSVCAALEALLRARGLRVGKYTSPHLVDFRERITIDGVPLAPEQVVEFVREWTDACERIGATFFEATTTLAFHSFAQANVDVAVVEVGLGGRLDSTNVLRPLVAGVTSIGVDHAEWLGATLDAIAREKGGIYKAGVPAVVGELDAGVRALLAERARAAGASAVRILAEECEVGEVRVDAGGTAFDVRWRGEQERLRTPLAGRHQAQNTMTALLMLDAAGAPYATGLPDATAALAQVRLAGRFQRHGRYLFDVAHNPAGARVLAETIVAHAPAAPVVALFGVLADKDWRAMMHVLAPVVDHFVLTTPPTAPAERAWRVDDALAHATAHGWSAEACSDSAAALAVAERRGATVLITGSFHTVGDAMVLLQLSPTSA